MRLMAGIAIASLALIPLRGTAQEFAVHQATTAPLDARYEIVQSTLAAKHTFRLDRFMGATDVLVVGIDGARGWQAIPRLAHPDDARINARRPAYQVFTSGLAVKHTFLINVVTGATWELFEDPSRGLFWSPFR